MRRLAITVPSCLRRAATGLLLPLALLLAGPAAADPARMAQATSAYGAGDYKASAVLLETEVADAVANKGERDPDALTAMNDLARAYGGQGRLAEQLALNEKVLQLRTKVLGERHPDTLTSMSNLAVTYGDLGRTAEQLALHEQVLKLRTEILGERHPDTLTSMYNLARTYSAVDRTAEELALKEKVLKLRMEILGERHPDTLRSMNGLAVTYGDLGRWAEQLALYEKALQLRTEVLGERHPDTLASMSNLGIAYGDQGRPADRVALWEKVLKMRIEMLGERHPDTLVSMSNLGVGYRALGRMVEMLVLDEKVLKLRSELLGERHPDTLNSMNNLALAYGALGRGAEELALDEKVVELRKEVLGERHRATLASMVNLAFAYGNLGRTSEQLALNERVVRLHTEVMGERHPQTLQSMSNLANSYGAVGRREEDLALTEKVLKLRTEVFGERHPVTLLSMSNLAANYGDLGRIDEQLALDQKVLQLRREILGNRHPDTLLTLSNLAQTYGVLGRRAEQLALNESVLKLRTQTLGARHGDTLKSTAYLASTLVAMDRKGEAAALSAGYLAGAEWQRSQPGLSSVNRQSVFSAFADGYRLFSTVHGSLGQTEQGFNLSELGKARTLLESMSVQRAADSGALPAAEQAALEDLNRQSAALDNLVARASSPEAAQRLEADRNELVRRYEALQQRLKAQYPKYAQLSEPHLVGLADLPGLLPRQTVAVSYLVHEQVLAAWVVDGRGQARFKHLGLVPNLHDAVQILRLASAEAGSLTKILAARQQRAWQLKDGSYRLLDTDQQTPDGAVAVSDAAEVFQWLSGKLLHPLAQDLAHAPHWVISPDGALAQLPFELLSLQGHRVLDRHQVHYTQSISTYALARARQRAYAGLHREQDLLALGNPEYQAGEPAPASPQARAASLNLRMQTQLTGTRNLWQPLPGTEAEVQALRKVFRSGQTLTHAEASEARLLALNASGALKHYRYLHFATHGFFSEDNPALSSVVLSQVNLPPGTDGFVTAAKWTGYELRSDLVVLSACETGLGRNLSGEGVMGLPFALFVAGNTDTVVSLWPVDDSATALFMQTFYGKLRRGRSAAQALTETKREFEKHPRFSHPRFWAAFVLIGAG